jgi:hypothetical protein
MSLRSHAVLLSFLVFNDVLYVWFTEYRNSKSCNFSQKHYWLNSQHKVGRQADLCEAAGIEWNTLCDKQLSVCYDASLNFSRSVTQWVQGRQIRTDCSLRHYTIFFLLPSIITFECVHFYCCMHLLMFCSLCQGVLPDAASVWQWRRTFLKISRRCHKFFFLLGWPFWHLCHYCIRNILKYCSNMIWYCYFKSCSLKMQFWSSYFV